MRFSKCMSVHCRRQTWIGATFYRTHWILQNLSPDLEHVLLTKTHLYNIHHISWLGGGASVFHPPCRSPDCQALDVAQRILPPGALGSRWRRRACRLDVDRVATDLVICIVEWWFYWPWVTPPLQSWGGFQQFFSTFHWTKVLFVLHCQLSPCVLSIHAHFEQVCKFKHFIRCSSFWHLYHICKQVGGSKCWYPQAFCSSQLKLKMHPFLRLEELLAADVLEDTMVMPGDVFLQHAV